MNFIEFVMLARSKLPHVVDWLHASLYSSCWIFFVCYYTISLWFSSVISLSDFSVSIKSMRFETCFDSTCWLHLLSTQTCDPNTWYKLHILFLCFSVKHPPVCISYFYGKFLAVSSWVFREKLYCTSGFNIEDYFVKCFSLKMNYILTFSICSCMHKCIFFSLLIINNSFTSLVSFFNVFSPLNVTVNQMVNKTCIMHFHLYNHLIKSQHSLHC